MTCVNQQIQGVKLLTHILHLKVVLVYMYVISVSFNGPNVLQAAKAAGEQAQAANGGQIPPYPGLDRRIPSAAKLADLEASQQDLPNRQSPGDNLVACAESGFEPSSFFALSVCAAWGYHSPLVCNLFCLL